MDTQYYCENEQRRQAVRNSTTLNGIDYLEVSEDQKTLVLHFIHNLPGQTNPVPADPSLALTANNVVIEGGVRVRGVRVESVGASGDILTLMVNAPGDFSTYTLRLVASPTLSMPPVGFDPQLSRVRFSFKVDCPSDFDCKPTLVCPPESLPEPLIDYMAKDYASFRRLILDRLGVLMPDWKERSPADLGIALVEVLAYAADHLSYYQDAVATEAYLGTARKRVSVRRHTRLLDYPMHDGCNARVWVQVQVADEPQYTDGVVLSREEENPSSRVRFLTQSVDRSVVEDDQLPDVIGRYEPEVFEPAHDAVLYPSHNEIFFYTWDDDLCCLPKGATRATLRDDAASRLRLYPGDVLIFEERVGPGTGLEADADRMHRHAVRLMQVYPAAQRAIVNGTEVRTPGPLVTDILTGQPIVEIEWHEEDALPFPLCISALIRGSAVAEVSVVRGNIVLADHGRTIEEESLIPEAVPEEGKYRPRLQRTDITYAAPYRDDRARAQPATEAVSQNPRAALPAVWLTESGEQWTAKRDLLGSDRFSPEFVVEMEDDERAYLRFGDGVTGRKPFPGARPIARYRIGNGSTGNVGAEAVTHIVTAAQGIALVRNPLPAIGGTDPEPTAQVRLYAPQAFRTQERAVTEEDYADVSQRHPEVQKAMATLRWTGSWHTMFITVDRKGGRPVDADFEAELRAFLERFRLAGYDLEIDAPRFVPLDIAMTVCVAPGYFSGAVKAALLETFSNVDLPDGRRGFFHPDNFTFGQTVYLSQIIAAAMQVPGVLWVDIDDTPPKPNRFQRWGQSAHGELAEGRITMDRLEIARLDNDPNAQENGKIEFIMEGGL